MIFFLNFDKLKIHSIHNVQYKMYNLTVIALKQQQTVLSIVL